MTQFLDENFWLTLSFCIFIYLVYKPIKKVILSLLDTKITLIKAEILEAEKLKNEAKLLYEEATAQINQLHNIQDKILKDGEKSINIIFEEKNREFELFLKQKHIETIKLIEEHKAEAIKSTQHDFCNNVIDLVVEYLRLDTKTIYTDKQIIKELIDNPISPTFK